MRAAALLALALPLAAQDDDAADRLVGALEARNAAVLARAEPWIVAVRVDREPDRSPPPPNAFGARPNGAVSSGVVIDPAGYVLTSHFNVEGMLRKIEIVLPNGSVRAAELQGFDAALDIALLKIPAAKGLAVPEFAKLDRLVPAQPVFVVGRAPDAHGLTINPGVLSATDRFAGKMVQADVKVNFGNVGGPLVDAEGRLIGVTCKVSTESASTFGQNSGVSFAAKWEKIADVLPRLKQGARITRDRRPFLGVTYDSESVDPGVTILDVREGSAAQRAGIRPGDVILEFDGEELRTPSDLLRVINRLQIGDSTSCKLRRGSETLQFEVKLGEWPYAE